MNWTHLLATGIAIAATAGCAASSAGNRSPAASANDSAPTIVVVLRDASPPSQKARFEVSRSSALRSDGTAVDLAVLPTPPDGNGLEHEVLWLEGSIPFGSYSGLEISFRSAALSGAEGDSPLGVPEVPVPILVPFVATERSVVVLEVVLRSSLAGETPFRFSPVLEARERPRPPSGLLALASVGAWEGVAVFDKRSGALASVLPTGRGPEGLALDPERLRAYVAVSGEDAVAVLDLLEGRTLDRIFLRAGDSPRDVALTRDGRTLVVANAGSDTVSFLDPLSAIEVERVPVQGRPRSLLMDRDGSRAFVLAERSSTITVVSVPGRSVTGSIAVESGPIRARFVGRASERLLVAHDGSPHLLVVDPKTLAVERRVYVGSGARALEVDRRSGRIFLARARTGRVEVFDSGSFLPVEEIPVPAEVAWLSVESEGNRLGVLLRDPSEARIVGIVGSAIQTRTHLGGAPAALRFVQDEVGP